MNEKTKNPDSKQFDDQYIQWKLERQRRLRIVMIITPGLAGVILVMLRSINPDYFYHYSLILSPITLMAFGFSALGAIMLYLQTGFKKANRNEVDFSLYKKEMENIRLNLEKATRIDEDRVAILQKELYNLKNEINTLSASTDVLSEEQKRDFIENLKANLQSETSSKILKDIQEKVSLSLQKDSRITEINEQFYQTNTRLNKELSSLSRRGNLNLSLGIVTTVAGLIVLAYFVFSARNTSENTLLFMSYFVPRISLIIFIELFAYFFLKLYKSSLSEIKYFQNEITNVEAKHIALLAALSEVNKVCEQVINDLSSTERNYILNKGQTTINLEKAKLEKDMFPEIIEKITNLLKRVKD